jgi:hypothetical protein
VPIRVFPHRAWNRIFGMKGWYGLLAEEIGW